MDISSGLIEQIVRLVIAELARQGLLNVTHAMPAETAGTVTLTRPTAGRLVVTEEAIRTQYKGGARRLRLPAGSIITPAARDWAREKHIELAEYTS